MMIKTLEDSKKCGIFPGKRGELNIKFRIAI